MAYFEEPGGNRIYLLVHHLFGRLQGTVDTRLCEPFISRVHATVEWADYRWQIKDVSCNGIWLNYRKINKDCLTPLSEGDIVQFGSQNTEKLLFKDASAPANFLCHQNGHDILALEPFQLLPNDYEPELVIYETRNQWRLERVDVPNTATRLLYDRDWIVLNKERWQLRLVIPNVQTHPVLESLISLDTLHLTYHLSSDEESTTLNIETPEMRYDLKLRSHHYLTLNLARYRYRDHENAFSATEQGWVYTEELANSLGLSENSLNIHIFRARKQFCECFANDNGGAEFIQRRNGQVRLGCKYFSIYKGDNLECTIEARKINSYAKQS